VQFRPPQHEAGLYCVNAYLLPALRNADQRSPEGKADALARAALLDQWFNEPGPFDLARMQTWLRHHGKPGLCRHGDGTPLMTEYSMIALPAHGRVLFADDHPCDNEYQELRL